jgi:hypothetical protein
MKNAPKPPLSEQDIIKLCAEHGVHFVNRSYGKATTKTVGLDSIQKIVEAAALRGFAAGMYAVTGPTPSEVDRHINGYLPDLKNHPAHGM